MPELTELKWETIKPETAPSPQCCGKKLLMGFTMDNEAKIRIELQRFYILI